MFKTQFWVTGILILFLIGCGDQEKGTSGSADEGKKDDAAQKSDDDQSSEDTKGSEDDEKNAHAKDDDAHSDEDGTHDDSEAGNEASSNAKLDARDVLKDAVAKGNSEGKAVFVHFTAEW